MSPVKLVRNTINLGFYNLYVYESGQSSYEYPPHAGWLLQLREEHVESGVLKYQILNRYDLLKFCHYHHPGYAGLCGCRQVLFSHVYARIAQELKYYQCLF